MVAEWQYKNVRQPFCRFPGEAPGGLAGIRRSGAV